MKHENVLFAFSHGDLQGHAKKILNYFRNNKESYGNPEYMPSLDYIEDNGEGEETFVIDVPGVAESYLYVNKEERDRDYEQLNTMLDLMV